MQAPHIKPTRYGVQAKVEPTENSMNDIKQLTAVTIAAVFLPFISLINPIITCATALPTGNKKSASVTTPVLTFSRAVVRSANSPFPTKF